MECEDSEGSHSFGQKVPPLYIEIKGVLQEYPDGQIFKEIIQNADDAGARTVRFYLDSRHHRKQSLVHQDLEKFQGPALLAYNDATFTRQDWMGIQNFKQSGKKDDPFKVGKFGIGFNSVYHITDLPTILSTDILAFLEPHEVVWPGQSGQQFTLLECHSMYQDSLAPYYGICGFSAGMSNFPGTLFRFPLRNKPSKLSDSQYSIKKLRTLTDALKSDAKLLLLFLRSVDTIEVHEIRRNGSHEQVFCVTIHKSDREMVSQQRQKLTSQLKIAHERQPFMISQQIVQRMDFHVRVTNGPQSAPSDSHWLVTNLIGCTIQDVLAAACELCIFPWVGVAMELTEHPCHENGRIFCFLPLSSDASSHFPVHLNGTFGISSNRRALKWSGSEAQNDSAAQWNELLVKHLIPLCYKELLGQAKRYITVDQFYQTWPDVTSIKQSPWEELLLPLLQSLFQGKNLWVGPPLQQWIAPNQGTFIPKLDPSFPQVAERVLAKCRLNLVKIPQVIWDALQHSSHDVSKVTPSYTRQSIRDNFISYKDLSSEDKQQLLTYCLSDNIYSDLEGLALLPLANGEFACFQLQSREYAPAYICSEDAPRELLPNLDHLLVDLSQQNPRLHETLQRVAASNWTNLQQLSVSTVAQQLPSCMPADWRNQQIVTPSSSSYPLDWFETFWEWLRRYNHNLQHFTGELVVPISKGADFNVIRLSRCSAVVCLSVYCHPDLRQALTKLNVKIADQNDFPYLNHRQLYDYLHKFTADGVLSAIACAYQGRVHQVQNVNLSANEACEMKSFLANSLNSFNSKQTEVLCNLPIFTIVGGDQLYSVQQAEQQSKCGSVMVEPQDFDIQICIPSNVVILSQSNKVSLLSSTQRVQTPNKLQFILSVLFPLVRSGHYPDHHLDSLMVEVLRRVPVLKSQFPACQHTELMSSIGSLCFIKTSNGERKAPKELFDPSSAELKGLYKDEPVFPIAPFDNTEYHLCLRQCGLQSSVNARQVVLIIKSICMMKSPIPTSVNRVKFSRAKAVLKYLSSCKSKFFSEKVTLSPAEWCTMGQAISILAIECNWLPVRSKPPDDYPPCLVWKGRTCPCHFTSLTSEVLVPTQHDSDILPSNTGSQMYIVDCSISPTLYEYFMSSLSVSHSEIVKHVWKHFQLVIQQRRDIHCRSLDMTVSDIYDYLQKHQGNRPNDVDSTEWIWIKRHHFFVCPEVCALKNNPTFPHNLEPYLYVIPERLAQDYSSLFKRYGVVEELSQSQIVSVLKMIKDRKRADVDGVTAMKVVLNILKWLTDDGMRKPELSCEDALLVPIQSTLDYPELVPPEDSVYTDNTFLQGFLESSDSANEFSFINQQITSEVAHMLGVIPLTRHLNISEDSFEDVGQHEPLITRLKNILEEYRDGVTIIKELLQNADDAEAKEVNICYDARSHDVPPKSLLYTGMLRCHGPALVVHNDASFTKDDFMNITKLAGETKMDKPLKIGKFGVGFCSVYHITDIPSFVSQEMLYIFDPTMSHLGKEIRDSARPGKKVKFTDRIVRCSRQLEPFEGLYGFDKRKSYKGTIFRLPFRTSHSEISSVIYTDNMAKKLSKSIQKSSSQLLLFLQNVTKITYSQINPGETSPTVLYEIRKHSTNLSSNPPVSIHTIDWSPSTSQASQESFLVASHVDNDADFGPNHKYATASVACLLDTVPSPSTPSFPGGHCYIPRTVAGEIFCFLPLAVHSGLPVHISCNFAVMKSRKGIQTSSDPSDTLAQFNIGLMEHVIPQAYCNLLEALQGMCKEGNVPQESYKFFSLWPLKEKLKTHNPWEHFIEPMYKLISSRELLFSEPIWKWVTLAKSEILHPGILSTWPVSSNEPPLKCVINVVQILGCQFVDLPAEYREQLPKSELDSSIMDEHRFVQLFFSNITLLKDHQDTRNEVLKNILLIFSIVSNQCSSNRQHYLEGFLRNNQCVPCTPVGAELKNCKDIVDPLASFARLYDTEDGVFPISDFCTNKLINSALTQLGMVQDHMPWDMLVERATTIQKLYEIEPIKALERAELIIECINRNLIGLATEVDHKSIASISFLPVMKKPKGYPLYWKGESYKLLCGNEILCNTEANIRLAGSQLPIVCDSSPNCGGCGEIPSFVSSELNITATPSFHVVIEHLCNLVDMFTTKHPGQTCHTTPDVAIPKRDIENICSEVYKYLDGGLEDGTITELHRLTSQPCVWTGECFITPDVVARKWLHKGPYLFCLPHTLMYKFKLTDALGIKEKFVFEDFVSALERMYKEFADNPVTDGCIRTISVIIPELCGCDNIPDEFACFLPDDKSVLCKSSELAYNDAPWCQIEEEWRFIHTNISRDSAIKLGVKPVRSKLLERYESPSDNFGGVEFGQREFLTQRIKNILTQYPCDETVLKELLQNADDAMAKKMYVIFDQRTHGKERVPKKEWADLQGPALLVWNDSTFTEKDLEGIQQLGLGSKRSDEDSIGQYGIGFNVVYNLTDCPSFITDCDGETLCVLDPHCRYIPGANELKPGRRYNKLDERFWSNYADLETAYLRRNISDCPPEMKRGTLFRFPLRSTPELVQRSELVDKENSKSSAYNNPRLPISLQRMHQNIGEWVFEMKQALFFLNHITEIRYFAIEEHANNMTLTNRYEVILSAEAQASRATLHDKVKAFAKTEQVPHTFHYPLTLVDRTLSMHGQYNERSERWLIQQGVGDQLNPEQVWKFTPQVKPKHGIAAPLQLSEGTIKHFRGTVFCFLPLPVASRLPVHVNGNFILDSSRRDLWHSTKEDDPDDRTKWNKRLVEAIASSYVKFLASAQDYYIDPECPYENMEMLLSKIKCYYNTFPTWLTEEKQSNLRPPEGLFLFLASTVYKMLEKENETVMATISKVPTYDSQSSTYTNTRRQRSPKVYLSVEWHPLHNKGNPSKQVYFCNTHKIDKELIPVLESIGMQLSAATIVIRKHFLNLNIKLPEITTETVFQYYSQFHQQVSGSNGFPCRISDTAFKSVGCFQRFSRFLLHASTDKLYYGTGFVYAEFPKQPFELPLLLTADGQLRVFDKDNMVICSRHCKTFPQSGDKFLHPEMIEMKYFPEYFIQASDTNWLMIETILRTELPSALEAVRVLNATSHIKRSAILRPLWLCLSEDKVFKHHLEVILRTWALLLSTQNQLFSFRSWEQLLPVIAPDARDEQECLYLPVFRVLQQASMPVLDINVVPCDTATTYCPTFLCPQSILRSLFFLHKIHTDEEGLTMLLSEGDSDRSIMTLFEYFKDIHFGRYPDSLYKLKCLPLFKDVSGQLRTLEGKAYIWPSQICSAGCNRWLTKTNAVFLRKTGAWTKLGSAEVLDIRTISVLRVYSEFIFPNFGLLTAEERIQQLDHIREQLFDDANSDKSSKHSNKSSDAIQFINDLETLPCLPLPDGELRPVRDFCDPDVLLFTTFCKEFYFPPHNMCSYIWLKFLRKIGLRQKAKQEKFKEFCRKVSNGDHQDLVKASDTILKYLMKAEEWYSDEVFLAEVSAIPFVCAEHLPQLNWIKPIHEAENRIQQGRKVVALTCLNGAALHGDCSTLLWTVKSIVKLPSFAAQTQQSTKAVFLEHIGVITTPTPCDVVNNIQNISKSRFSSFALFDKYTDDCKQKQKECSVNCLLVSVLTDNFHFLHQQLGSYPETILHPLRELPCIPVCAEGRTSNIKQPVLVHPLQVITEGKECRQAHPFINPIPDVLFSFSRGVLSKIGVESMIQPIHVRNALETVHTCIKQPLDPNTIKAVQYLLKQLYLLLKDNTETEMYSDSLPPLFLPNADRKLVQSTHLVCNDKHQYRKTPLDFSSTCYSLFGLLSSNPQTELGFTQQKLCNCLPLAVSPILLSSCCEEELHSSCTEVVGSTYISNKLCHTFNLHVYIARAARLIINYKVQAAVEQECLKFTTALQEFLQNTEIKVYKHLQADLFLTLVSPRRKFGIADVPFLIQKSEEQTFCLCLSEVTPLNLLSLLASSILSCVAQQCGVDPKALGNPDSIIERLLTAESPDHIVDILEDLDVPHESFEMDDMEITVSNKKLKLGDPVPLELHYLLDPENIFRPEELVGYEEHTDYIIFARVVYRIRKDAEDEEEEEGYAQYLIYTREDDESGKIVSVLDLYKFTRITESMLVINSCEVAIPEDSDATRMSEAFHEEGGSEWKKIKKEICNDLRRIWKLPDKEKRKGTKRLYLKWHPDKNDHWLATKAFQFLKQQIARLEVGLPLNEDNEDENHETPSCWRPWWDTWDDIAARHGRSQQRARTRDDITAHHGRSQQRARDSRGGLGGWSGWGGGGGGGGISSWWYEMMPQKDVSKATVWLQQAEVDMKVLKTILVNIDTSPDHAGHICFLAHEVAEKALKAGKYATCGLHSQSLRNHELVGHAGALEQLEPQLTIGLHTSARALSNYYIETRFPNHYSPPSVPADHFTPDQARNAHRNAEGILQMMRNVVK